MKRIKTIATISTLGITGIVLSTSLISCSEKEKPNLVINSYADFDKYFTLHHNEFDDSATFNNGFSQSNELIEYFITNGRLTAQNLLYSELYRTLQYLPLFQHSPLELLIKTDGFRISAKNTSDF
jgi:hypothetical protein